MFFGFLVFGGFWFRVVLLAGTVLGFEAFVVGALNVKAHTNTSTTVQHNLQHFTAM